MTFAKFSIPCRIESLSIRLADLFEYSDELSSIPSLRTLHIVNSQYLVRDKENNFNEVLPDQVETVVFR